MTQRGMTYRLVRFMVLWAVLTVAVRLGTGVAGTAVSWSAATAMSCALLLPTLPPERVYRRRRRADQAGGDPTV